jgi:uncharacterized protein (TIGR02145 family)
MKKFSLAFIFIFSVSHIFFSQVTTIGNQTWTTENLSVTKFRNGDEIPQAHSKEEMETYSNAKEPAWCFYDFNPKLGKKFGKMYNSYVLSDPRGISPEGWHIPSIDEFTTLVEILGGQETARYKLKSKSGWENNQNGTNSSNFSALPGGHTGGSKFLNMGYSVFFWSSTPMDSVYMQCLSLGPDTKDYVEIEGETVAIYQWSLFTGMHLNNYSYIRCIKD